MAADESALSREEIDFLRDLFREIAPELAQEDGRRMRLDATGTDAELLAQLLDSHRLSLTAERDGLLIRFELSLHQPQAGHPLEISFSRPTITERHDRERAARVRPSAEEVAVHDADGQPLPVRVRDISSTGMALASREGSARPGSRVSLRLRLEGGGETDIQGRVVRVQEEADSDECTLGVAFEHADARTRSLLERFVFRKHPALRH